MKIRHVLTSLIICLMSLVLTGCANLSYTGQDYNSANVSTVQTDEGFYFSTYKKSLNDIDLELGITKTTLESALVIYVGVKNNGINNYILNQSDFTIKDGYNRKISPLPPSAYINAYRNDQTSAYAGMQTMAPTINRLAEVANNFQQIDTMNPVSKMQDQQNILGKQINQALDGINENSLPSVATIPSQTKKYYYIFIERPNDFPISITYKDLSYTFGTDKDKTRILDGD